MDSPPDLEDPEIAHADEDDDPEGNLGEAVAYDLGVDEKEDEESDDRLDASPGHRRIALDGSRIQAEVHLAPALRILRDEINERWPRRDKTSDGWIGDAAHQARKSDHNPDTDDNSVNAADFDKDGIDPILVVRKAVQHPSTQYVIFDRTIWSRVRGFKPARYTGANPHDKHLHVSVSHTPALENSAQAWGIAAARVERLGDRVLRNGSEGGDVRELQILANQLGGKLVVDGEFGSKTEAWVRNFQRSKSLAVDGVVGPKTTNAILEATKPRPRPRDRSPGTRTLTPGMTGKDVAFVQQFIGERRCGKSTGVFDDRTENGVRWYQKMRGVEADGIVGRITWREMRVTTRY
ncbi:peptidoglycan-binding protein [Micromonospora sp. NPDC005806]|uniref:peptidoglycan-binding domain-containing protein n=1 Tax=Micromonospora sp. NPDC005806 TaxID=3364234 RepID=UPI00368D82E8